MEDYDKPAMAKHEHELLEHASKQLLTIDGLRIIGTAKEVGVIDFVIPIDGVHHYMTSGPCSTSRALPVRTGHHCTQPLMERFGERNDARELCACSTRWKRWSDGGGDQEAVKMLR